MVLTPDGRTKLHTGAVGRHRREGQDQSQGYPYDYPIAPDHP